MAATLYVDADACPVKEEVYRVARRYGLQVFVVSNSLRLRRFQAVSTQSTETPHLDHDSTRTNPSKVEAGR